MKQESVHISYDSFERFAEFTSELELSPDERVRYRHEIDQKNVGSIILPVYYFDTVKEFLAYQNRLVPQVSEVTFTQALTVSDRRVKENVPFRLYLTDGTGVVTLEDAVTPNEITRPSLNLENFEFIDPIFGSRVGDSVQVDLARYLKSGIISVDLPWFLHNDSHYERTKQSRFKWWMVEVQEWMDI